MRSVEFREGESTFYPDVLAISGFGFHRTQGFSGLMNEDSELVLVKIVKRVRQAFIESIEVWKQFLRQDDQFVDHRSFFEDSDPFDFPNRGPFLQIQHPLVERGCPGTADFQKPALGHDGFSGSIYDSEETEQ